MVYLCERRGLPSLGSQRETLAAAGLTAEELAEAYVDRISLRARPGQGGQPERDYLVAATREGDEVHIARPAVIATNEGEALAFLAGISGHGAVLCCASGERFQSPPEAQAAVADALRLVAAVKADERAAVLEAARAKRKPGKKGGKVRVPADLLEAAREHWFNHDIAGDEAAKRAGIGKRTLARALGPRGSPAFGAALNRMRKDKA